MNQSTFQLAVIHPELRLGVVAYVSASEIRINLRNAGTPTATHFHGDRHGKGEVGEFVIVEGQTKFLLGRIICVRLPERERHEIQQDFVGNDHLDAIGIERPSSTWSGRKVVCGVDVWLDRGGDDDTMREEVVDRNWSIQFLTDCGEQCSCRATWATGRWRRRSSIEGSMSFQYSVDRRLERRFGTTVRRISTTPHFSKDGVGSVLAEDAFLFELLADRQYALFDFLGGTVGRSRRSVGLVRPVDSVKSLAVGSYFPPLNRGGIDAELFGDVTDRSSATDGLYHATALSSGESRLFSAFYCHNDGSKTPAFRRHL